MADDMKKSQSTKRLELCAIITVLLVGIALAITVIVYLVENKPKDSGFIKPDASVQKTPYAAVNSGVEWLRRQQKDYTWPQGQSADAVLALGLGKMEEFNKDNCEFRLAIKSAEFDILSAMLTNSNLNDAVWGRGVLAKYIVALRTACVDVAMFHNNNNLITVLDTQYNTYKNYYDGDRRALSWYTLARCTAGEAMGSDIVDRLKATPGTYNMGVEEAAMVTIALSCMDYENMTMYGREIMAAQDYIISQQHSDGTFGNEFETALALQALKNSNVTNLLMIQNKALEYLSNLIQDTYNGQYKNLAAASHIMTALAGNSFADAKMQCPDMMTTTPAPGQAIQITIRARGGVINASVSQDYTLTINRGQSLYQALQLLQIQQSSFMFTVVNTARGNVIQSVMGLNLNPNSLQYWKIMEGSNDVTNMGVDYIIPMASQTFTIEAVSS